MDDLKTLPKSNLLALRKRLKIDIEIAQNSFNDLEEDQWIFTPIEERRAENERLEAEIQEKQSLIEEIDEELDFREKRRKELLEAYDETLEKYNEEVAKFKKKIIEAFGLRDLELDFEAIEELRDKLNNIAMEANKNSMMRQPPRYMKMGTLLIDTLKGD